MRRRAQNSKHEKIQRILSEFKGLKNIAAIKGATRKQSIQAVQDQMGTLKTETEEIAEVFASFYERLYTGDANQQTQDENLFEVAKPVEATSLEEVLDALRGMKRDRAKDVSGVVAEMLKDASQDLLLAVVNLFNDVLSLRSPPPSTWKKTKLIVLFKKGNPQLASNYRPISILSILYKLFFKNYMHSHHASSHGSANCGASCL